MQNVTEITKSQYVIRCCLYIIFISLFLITLTAFSASADPNVLIKNNVDHDLAPKQKMNIQNNVQPMILNGQKLTVNMPSTTVKDALYELNRHTGIEIVWMGTASNRQISIALTGLRIDEAVKRILRDESYALIGTSPENTDKIIILSSNDWASDPMSSDQSPIESDLLLMSDAQEKNIDEWSSMEEKSMERMNKIEAVKAIAMYEDEEQASEELHFELATNTEPEARLLALTSLDQIGYLENDTLIQILNEDEDPRVMLQTIDYLIKRVGTDHRIEEVLSAFFDSHMEMNNT